MQKKVLCLTIMRIPFIILFPSLTPKNPQSQTQQRFVGLKMLIICVIDEPERRVYLQWNGE